MIKTRLLKLLSGSGKYIVYQILWQWIALVAQVFLIGAVARLLGNVLQGAVTAADLQRCLAVCLVAVAVRFVCDRLAARASYQASADVKKVLREKIYGKLLRLGNGYRERVTTSQVVQMAAEGVEQLEIYFGKYLSQLFYSLIAPVTLFIILFRVNRPASIVLLVCVPLIPVSIVAVMKIAKRLLQKYWGIYTGLGDSFLENLQGLTTLKIYQADEQKAREMDEEAQHFRRITMKVLTMQLNSTSVMDIVAYGGAAVGILVVLNQFFKGAVDFSGALMIILLASEFFIPLRLLGSFFHIAMNGMAASDKIFEFLDLPEPEVKQGYISEGEVSVVFQDVRFSYEEEREILKGVSLDFAAGSFVSLVGTSGCGKSTIAGILMGRNKGYQGRIAIYAKDGILELSEVNEASLMKNITLVSHNSYLFKGTVEENLRLGKPDASEEELWEVLRLVNLHGFVESQKGLLTAVQEKGGNLSGGQCQRLALARALLHDSPVYIFDEATSNIDMESEEMIMKVIHDLAKTKTVILISHRLANVVESDCIYMMQQGRIVETGTHAQLLEMQGAYAALYRQQSELERYSRSGCQRNESKLDIKNCGERIGSEQCEGDNGKRMEAGQTAEMSKKRRSGVRIMGQLIGLIKPLLPVMILAIFLGVVGYLCAIFLTILGGHLVMSGMSLLSEFGGMSDYGGLSGYGGMSLLGNIPMKVMCAALVIMAVLRGVLHYGEQYCNHFIAFKLLAIIRHKVFAALRKLCPAKLEGKDKGNLISILTSDIELLEVFYAHTISPIVIAAAVSVFMALFIGRQAWQAGVLAACGYGVVGVVLPLINGKLGADAGMSFRSAFGDLNSFVLDSLRGLDETMQYDAGYDRLGQMKAHSDELGQMQKTLNGREASQRSFTNLAILGFSLGMLFLMIFLLQKGQADFPQLLTAVIAMMGSFGPVVALSNLSNNLMQTLASGERVLSVLEEEPQVEEVSEGISVEFAGAAVHHVDFSYEKEQILKDVSLDIPKGSVIGIHGVSGSGKSTLLKLLMRFWDPQEGTVSISGTDVRKLNTSGLRDMESYVTQETSLFKDTIANNIGLAKHGASREEIMEAAKKASIHDFIMTLPKGYDTPVGELGDTLSGGERQRIGIARAFLHDAPLLLLDEPTSNLDSLNEGIILKSLQESCREQTVVLVSHRASTMGMADVIYEMDAGRRS